MSRNESCEGDRSIRHRDERRSRLLLRSTERRDFLKNWERYAHIAIFINVYINQVRSTRQRIIILSRLEYFDVLKRTEHLSAVFNLNRGDNNMGIERRYITW